MTKIRVRIGGAEAEVEAEPDRLAEAIELIPKLAAKLQGAGRQMGTPIAQSPMLADGQEGDGGETGGEGSLQGRGQQRQQRNRLPTIMVEKGDSLADIIGKFFADPWGREQRKLLDVREALQSYGMNYPKQSVAVALLRLAKATKIRRFKAEDGEFVYTSASVPLTPNARPVMSTLDSAEENRPVELSRETVSEFAPDTGNSTV